MWHHIIRYFTFPVALEQQQAEAMAHRVHPFVVTHTPKITLAPTVQNKCGCKSSFGFRLRISLRDIKVHMASKFTLLILLAHTVIIKVNN